MNKREILLYTIGLPFVIMLAFMLAIFVILVGDPNEGTEGLIKRKRRKHKNIED